MAQRQVARELFDRDARAEARKLEEAVDQLERAELYVEAALDIGLADPRHRRVLESLRANVVLARRCLKRPVLVEEAGRPIG
jgi:hypothetical protein